MSVHEEMAKLNADQHPLVSPDEPKSAEEYTLNLMKKFAYVIAVQLAKNKTVLDLGCNDGYGTQLLSRSAAKTVGIDVSEKAIQKAIDQFGNDDIEFHLADGAQLPFEENQFDLVVSFQVIEHVGDCFAYLSEIKRVLKPNGQVIITTPNAVIRLDPGMKPWNRFHVKEYNHSELKLELERFFPHVGVRGLYAKGEFYSVVINRMARARNNARIQQQKPTIWKAVKKRISRTVFARLNAIRERLKMKSSQESCAKEISDDYKSRFSIDQLVYSPDHLDDGMNLMAICANKETAFKEIEDVLNSYKE